MKNDGFGALLRTIPARALSRRRLLGRVGLPLGAASLSALVAACAAAAPTATTRPIAPTVTPPPPPATKPPAPTVAAAPVAPTAAATKPSAPAAVPSTKPAGAAAAQPAAGIATVKVRAYEQNGAFLFDADTVAVPAGPVRFEFANAGKVTHELMVYPPQDLSEMFAKTRQGTKVEEMDYIKGMVARAEDIDAGKSATVEGTLKPGFYELACHVKGKNPDGTTFLHSDKGQTLTLAATGPGGPSLDIATPASTVRLDMVPGEGDLASSWLFAPDRLVARAGEVTFKVTNRQKEEHDVVVYPLGDITQLIAAKLKGEKPAYAGIKGDEIIADLPAGQSLDKAMKLTPGPWVAACFMIGKSPDGASFLHRDRGQRFTFLVR